VFGIDGEIEHWSAAAAFFTTQHSIIGSMQLHCLSVSFASCQMIKGKMDAEFGNRGGLATMQLRNVGHPHRGAKLRSSGRVKPSPHES
jgi:hypothetical protein